MKKFYLAMGKLCLPFFVSLLFTQFAKAQIRTYDTTFDGWNAIVTEDLSLQGKDSAAGIIFFPGIGQQNTDINGLTVNGPHYLIKAGIWDGSVVLGNGVHHPFIISLQPPKSGFPATVVKPKIDEILARYRIKRNSLYFTALSQGSWQANEFITYQAAPGDHTYGRMVRAMVNLEGVEPADDQGIYSSLPYPQKMGDWALNCGGRELWVEGSQDWRDMEAGADNMNAAVPGSATYFMVNYGGGAHCCWNTEYEPNVTWTTATNKNIVKVDGNQVPMNVWQWLLRQGDTSMPGGAATPQGAVAPAPAPPNVSAGSAQTITLPTSLLTLSGTAAGSNGAKITSLVWQQTQGPATTKIGSPGSLTTAVTGLTVAGNYGFQLTATDQNGKQATATVAVTVNPAPAPPAPQTPPNVAAGNNVTITLPATTATLTGTASGTNGAKITALLWQEASGPVPARIGSPGSLTTGISGLTDAGTYQFRFTATESNGKQAAAVVVVQVNAAPPVAKTTAPPPAPQTPPTVSAGKDQTITLPATTATLSGTASGTNGAKITALLWQEASGPAQARIGSPGSLTTGISGLTDAGTYQFRLTATESNGKQAAAVVVIQVDPAPPVAAKTSASQPPTVSAGKGQVITLPAIALTVMGNAKGNDGATIVSVTWTQGEGPESATIVSPHALTTSITGLTKPGAYVFTLTATDNHGKSANGSMTVTVKVASTGLVMETAPLVSAGANQTVTLPVSTTTLKGSASGRNGAVVDSYFWVLRSGPGWVKFSNEWAPTTTVNGLIAGTYVFELEASDANGESGSATMTLVVKPAKSGNISGINARSSEEAPVDPSINSIDHTTGLVIYPNPVQGMLNLHMADMPSGKVMIGIFDLHGARILTQEMDNEASVLETSIDVSRLAAGIYMIEVISATNQTTVQKFIKQ